MKTTKFTQTDPFIRLLDDLICIACGNSIFTNGGVQFSCHSFCKNCIEFLLSKQIEIQNPFLSCPICLKTLTKDEISGFNPKLAQEIEDLDRMLALQGGVIKKCPKCKIEFVYEPGRVAGITLDPKGRKIIGDALDCLRENRCTCSNCQNNFCVECNTLPFHDGYTCKEQNLINKGITCRFCNEPVLNGEEIQVSHRICKLNECKTYLDQSCLKILDCGHACCGLKNEKEHLPCGECEYLVCAFCGEDPHFYPSILLKCGHVSHLKCVETVFSLSSNKGLIKLPLCKYPGCNKIPESPYIQKDVKDFISLSDMIEVLLKKLIQTENVINDPRVLNPEDNDYYQQPLKLAKDTFLFFRCEKCNKPYFGGKKECDDQRPADVGGPYVCQGCSIPGSQTCVKHGNDNMVFKCFFCCNPAQWHCFGTTHFCEPCHRDPGKAQAGPHPVCDGKCDFAPHPPNGTKQYFGKCRLCESM